jgi:hypothetical protein
MFIWLLFCRIRPEVWSKGPSICCSKKQPRQSCSFFLVSSYIYMQEDRCNHGTVDFYQCTKFNKTALLVCKINLPVTPFEKNLGLNVRWVPEGGCPLPFEKCSFPHLMSVARRITRPDSAVVCCMKSCCNPGQLSVPNCTFTWL